jgi:hypothetical protein
MEGIWLHVQSSWSEGGRDSARAKDKRNDRQASAGRLSLYRASAKEICRDWLPLVCGAEKIDEIQGTQEGGNDHDGRDGGTATPLKNRMV